MDGSQDSPQETGNAAKRTPLKLLVVVVVVAVLGFAALKFLPVGDLVSGVNQEEKPEPYTGPPLSDPLANPTEEDMLSKTVRGATYDQNGNLMLAGFELGRDPQTPAEFAAAVLDTHNDDAVNRYLELWTPEMRDRIGPKTAEIKLKVHPTMTSMSVDRIWMPENSNPETQYYSVLGQIALEDGRTMKYDLLLLKEQGSIEIKGIDALYLE